MDAHQNHDFSSARKHAAFSSYSFTMDLRSYTHWSQLARGWNPDEETTAFLLMHAITERAGEIVIEMGSPHLKVFHTAGGRTYPVLPHLPGEISPQVSHVIELIFGLLVPKEPSWKERLLTRFGRPCPTEMVERPDFRDAQSVLPLRIAGPIMYGQHVLYEGDVKFELMRTKLDDENKSYKILVEYSLEQ